MTTRKREIVLSVLLAIACVLLECRGDEGINAPKLTLQSVDDFPYEV